MNAAEIVNRIVAETQKLILERESGLETRDPLLDGLDRILDDAKLALAKLRGEHST